jgi:hypothetical protein
MKTFNGRQIRTKPSTGGATGTQMTSATNFRCSSSRSCNGNLLLLLPNDILEIVAAGTPDGEKFTSAEHELRSACFLLARARSLSLSLSLSSLSLLSLSLSLSLSPPLPQSPTNTSFHKQATTLNVASAPRNTPNTRRPIAQSSKRVTKVKVPYKSRFCSGG